MAGLEVVVRPVVLPNIRPAAPRVLAPAADPDQGIATLGGSGGRLIDLTRSWSLNVSKQHAHQETERTYDVDKIYQKNDDGTINKENSVRVERATRIKLDDGAGNSLDLKFGQSPIADNIETEQRDLVRQFRAGNV